MRGFLMIIVGHDRVGSLRMVRRWDRAGVTFHVIHPRGVFHLYLQPILLLLKHERSFSLGSAMVNLWVPILHLVLYLIFKILIKKKLNF